MKERRRATKRDYLRGALQTTLVVIISVGALYGFKSRYQIGVNTQLDLQCLPYDVFLIDFKDQALSRGDFIAFHARGMAPYIPDGTVIIKELAGVPGDRVVVDKGVVIVNDANRGELDLVEKLNASAEHYSRNETVPDGKMWVMGTLPRSFDSRYWGYVEPDQIIGRAYALW